MMYDADLRRTFKSEARESIHEQFWPTMGATVLSIVPATLLSIIFQLRLPNLTGEESLQWVLYTCAMVLGFSVIYLLVQLFVLIPIHFGAMHYYTYRARGQEASPYLVFGCFGDGKAYINSLKIALSIFVRSLGWIVLFIAAVVAYMVLLFSLDSFSGLFALMTFVEAILLIALACLVNVKVRRYDGSYIRMIDDPDMSAWEATGACAQTFEGHNFELFVFDLSFLLWDIGTALTCGILGVYTTPYNTMSFVNYFDALREHETGIPQRQEKPNHFDRPDPNDLPPL